MQDQVINLENLIAKLQQNLKDIYAIEKEIIRLDQLIIAGKNTEKQLRQKVKNLNQNFQNSKLQRDNLKKIRDQAVKEGFRDLPRSRFENLQETWKTQDPDALSEILRNLSKTDHFSRQFYMTKAQTLRIIGMDISFNYHFTDIDIPDTLSLGE